VSDARRELADRFELLSDAIDEQDARGARQRVDDHEMRGGRVQRYGSPGRNYRSSTCRAANFSCLDFETVVAARGGLETLRRRSRGSAYGLHAECET
jgi:hypothetical protein